MKHLREIPVPARAILVIVVASLLLVLGLARTDTAAAHTVTNRACERAAWTATLAEQPNTHAEFRLRYSACRVMGARHNMAHRTLTRRAAYSCSRMSAGASYLECYRLGESSMPLSWITDSSYHALIRKESTWNPRAVNPSSGACGLHQFLPCRAFGSVRAQGDAGYRYIAGRYGSPARALAFHRAHGWY